MEISIEQRLTNLEHILNALSKKVDNLMTYDNYDKKGIRQTDDNQNVDISDNRAGIEESFESSLTNADDIADVRTALEEVYELIANEEE